METPFLDKFLKDHKPYCKMHEYSLQDERHCSCGKENAILEVEELLKSANKLFFAAEEFALAVCDELGIPYEDCDTKTVVEAIRKIKKNEVLPDLSR